MTIHRAATPISVTHPDLAAQMLAPFDPSAFAADSDEPVWWRGPIGHIWCATVAERVAGQGCPWCSRIQVPVDGRSLADLHPEVAAEATGWDPSLVSSGSRVPMPWTCAECRTRWTAEVRARANGHRPCPTCSAQERHPLTETHPGLAAEMMAPFDPDDYTHGSKAKVRWRGPVGHEWEATVANRVKGSGCPVCAHGAGARARKSPEPGATLADLYPTVAAEADGWDPREYRAKSSARRPWLCATCGHRWNATIYSRTQRSGCPACAIERRRKHSSTPSG
ncbi:MAG: zinc-ribbon domain-containing protein [Actinobacteria bacterium]|jgi:hypothetical protein|nr:zinc-ribbon domain-containing protein [Actinomycetota bacterium]